MSLSRHWLRFLDSSRGGVRGAATGAALITALATAPVAHGGEIYKWVDAQGRTHYSERKDGAGSAKPSELKIKVTPAAPAPPVVPVPAPGVADPQRQAASAPGPARAPDAAPAAAPPQRRESYRDETPSAKCALARDILSGAARRASGRPTDANDRQIAESDVRLFCGN